MKITGKEYIFFDLDGTLTDSQEGICKGLSIMMEHFGIDPAKIDMNVFLGPSLWYTCPKYLGLNEKQTEEAVTVFRKFYFDKGIYINRLYDGVLDLLEGLKAAGKKMAVATGKPENQAKIVTDYFKISSYFEFIGGSSLDDTRSTKSQVIAHTIKNCSINDSELSKIIMIGDRQNDIQGAKDNKIDSLGILWGYGTKTELTTAGANYIFQTPQEVLKALV